MKAHFCFRQFDHFAGSALRFQLVNGNLRVRSINSRAVLQFGWGPDINIILNCFLTMMNGRGVPKFSSEEEFIAWRQQEWFSQCRFHALFAERPGAIVDRPEVTYLNFTETPESIAGSASGAFSDDMF